MLDWIPRCFIQSIHLRQPSWGVLIGLCGTLFVRITPPSVRAGHPNSISIVLSFCQNNSIQWKSGPSRFYFNCAFFFFRNSPPSEIEFGALLPRPIIIPGKMLCFLSCLHNERHIWQVIVVYMQAGLYWRVFALHTSIRYWIRSSLSQTHHHSWVMNKIVYMYVSGFS